MLSWQGIQHAVLFKHKLTNSTGLGSVHVQSENASCRFWSNWLIFDHAHSKGMQAVQSMTMLACSRFWSPGIPWCSISAC
jgi:hypothetical protein